MKNLGGSCPRNAAGITQAIPYLSGVREIGRFVFAGGPMRLQGKYGFRNDHMSTANWYVAGRPGRKELPVARDRPPNFHGESRVGYQFNR